MGFRAKFGALTGLTVTLTACSTMSPESTLNKADIKPTKTKGQLAPVKLAKGDCGLFVWTGPDRRFSLFSQGRSKIRFARGNDEIFLLPDGEPGVPDLFGQYPAGSYVDAEGKTYSLSFRTADTLGESIRYSKGSLRSVDDNGWERMEAAFGLSTCLPGNGLPIEPELSASRSDLLRPLGRKHDVEPVRTAQVTLTPASLRTETTKVLSVPAVTQIERPVAIAMPTPPLIQKAQHVESIIEPSDPVTPIGNQTGPYTVQLASYLNEDRAEQAWEQLSAKNVKLATAKPNIVAAQVPDKGLYFRLQVGGYDNRSVAAQYCETLKDDGLDCFVTLRKF